MSQETLFAKKKLITSEESIMKNYIIVLSIFISSLYAQTLTGIVTDSSGDPLQYVFVRHGENLSTTNENGGFTTKIDSENEIVFSLIGYETLVVDLEKNTDKVFVLKNENIELQSVDVYGSTKKYLNSTTNSNALSKFSKGGSINQIPSIEIRTGGGYAGVSSASFDGGFARHTKVLYNEVDLTDAMNGQVDLSIFPSFALQSVNYRLNSGTRFGSGSIDGSININNNVNSNKIIYGSGDFGFNQYGATYNIRTDRGSRNIVFGKTEYDGNYEFLNTTTEEKEKRENNYLDQFFLSVGREFIINEKTLINFSSLMMENIRGVSGSTTFPSNLATRTDEFDLNDFSVVRFINKGTLKLSMNRSKNNQVYDDPNESFPVLSEHDLTTSRFGLNLKQKFSKSVAYELNLIEKSERVDSTDLAKREIDTTSMAVNVTYVDLEKNFKILPSLRYDSQPGNKETTYNLGLEAVDQFSNEKMGFDFNFDFGTSFQFPTMNDLFWPDGLYSGGNPDLKPEESDYVALKVTSNSFLGKISLSTSLKNYDNLIVWQPDESFKYIPINISSAERNSMNLTFLKSFEKVEMQVAYNKYESKDKELDKDLLYVPNSSMSLMLSYNLNKKTSLAMHYKKTGERILQYESSFSDEVIGPALSLLSIAATRSILSIDGKSILDATITIDNALDQEYESTLGYPEPGRSINLTLEYII